jgi:hypothetical protein
MASQSKPGNVTGRMREQMAKDNAEAQQARAAEMSLATAEAEVRLETEVIDATKPNRPTVVVDEVTVVGSADDDLVTIRVIDDIDSMTLGAGNVYSFKAGPKYQVTRNVARHLEEKGYLAGVI